MKVKKKFFFLKRFEKKYFKGKLKEMVCQNIEKYIHKDDQLAVLLDR
jgi:hypothetical protein